MEDHIRLAKEQVRRHFPEMEGVEPTVSQADQGVSIFTFRKTFATPDGARISRVVRVSIDREGRILKTTTSRG